MDPILDMDEIYKYHLKFCALKLNKIIVKFMNACKIHNPIYQVTLHTQSYFRRELFKCWKTSN